MQPRVLWLSLVLAGCGGSSASDELQAPSSGPPAKADAVAADPPAVVSESEPEAEPSPPSWYGELRTDAGLAPPVDSARKPTGPASTWERKDADADKELRACDTANAELMLGAWRELECLRLALVSNGEREGWSSFQTEFTVKADAWLQTLFAAEPQVLQRSLAISRILEAHDLLTSYVEAFTTGDELDRKQVDMRWVVAAHKQVDYYWMLGVPLNFLDAEDPAQLDGCRAFLDALP